MSEIVFGDNLSSIGAYAFGSCGSIKEFIIPASVTTIGRNAFYACGNSEGIWVDENNQYYSSCEKGCLYDKEKKVLIVAPGTISGEFKIPDSVQEIGEYAFAYCDNLTNIELHSDITIIGTSAFWECSNIQSFTIPASVTNIESYCFLGDTSLKNIYFEGDAPYIGYAAFKGLTINAYYPSGNASWTTDVMDNYEGSITWIAE